MLLVCCAFPAIYAGGYALLWLSDLYMLRTSRLHARIGFLFSLGLGAVMTLPSYGYFSRILLYAVPLQILFLLLLLSMLHAPSNATGSWIRRLKKPKTHTTMRPKTRP